MATGHFNKRAPEIEYENGSEKSYQHQGYDIAFDETLGEYEATKSGEETLFATGINQLRQKINEHVTRHMRRAG